MLRFASVFGTGTMQMTARDGAGGPSAEEPRPCPVPGGVRGGPCPTAGGVRRHRGPPARCRAPGVPQGRERGSRRACGAPRAAAGRGGFGEPGGGRRVGNSAKQVLPTAGFTQGLRFCPPDVFTEENIAESAPGCLSPRRALGAPRWLAAPGGGSQRHGAAPGAPGCCRCRSRSAARCRCAARCWCAARPWHGAGAAVQPGGCSPLAAALGAQLPAAVLLPRWIKFQAERCIFSPRRCWGRAGP